MPPLLATSGVVAWLQIAPVARAVSGDDGVADGDGRAVELEDAARAAVAAGFVVGDGRIDNHRVADSQNAAAVHIAAGRAVAGNGRVDDGQRSAVVENAAA